MVGIGLATVMALTMLCLDTELSLTSKVLEINATG